MTSFLSKIKLFFRSLGLYWEDNDNFTLPYNINSYRPTPASETIKEHRDFLKSINDQEEMRLAAIESKTSQLISQTGLIFSLLSLFVPILIGRAASLTMLFKILLLTLLILSFLLYLLTIRNALKNYRVNRFRYSRSSPNNVLKFQRKSMELFIAEEVRDLLYAIKNNENINNKKADNLLHSFKAFKLANIFTGVLVVIFSISTLFFPPEKNKISIENPIEVKHLDSIMHEIIGAKRTKDTILIISNSPIDGLKFDSSNKFYERKVKL